MTCSLGLASLTKLLEDDLVCQQASLRADGLSLVPGRQVRHNARNAHLGRLHGEGEDGGGRTPSPTGVRGAARHAPSR